MPASTSSRVFSQPGLASTTTTSAGGRVCCTARRRQRQAPSGGLGEDVFAWDGVRVQRWRREQPEADWVVVWIDLQTPGLGYWATPVHPADLGGGLVRQAASAQTTVDFLSQYH